MRGQFQSSWEQIDRCVGHELGELLGEPLVIAAPADTGAIVHTSQISLTFGRGQTHVRLCLGIDDETCGLLQRTLLGGDESDDAMSDALREMANTAAGAIRRDALEQGCELTIGLPSSGVALHAGSHTSAWSIVGASGIRIACLAIMGHIEPRAISTTELREGMVLARDVVDATGALVASAGISLTSTTVCALSRALRETAKLDVSYALA